MSARRLSFPFPPLPAGEVTPRPGAGDIQDLLQRDVRIVRWFVEKAGWTSRSIPPTSALSELLAVSEKLDLNGPSNPVESVEPGVARHLLHASASLARLAWAIRALHGNGGSIERVDASFITGELFGDDTKQLNVEQKLPAGIGTMVIAGRLVQAGGGRIVSINGNRGAGYDIEWTTGVGDTVLIERKDRSYQAGLADSPQTRIRRVIQETRRAGVTIPRRRGAVRVLMVGFQHLVRKREAKRVDRAYMEAVRREFGGGRVRGADLPNLLVVEHLGLEPKTGGEKYNYFSPQLLNPKPKELVRRAVRLMLKSFGAPL